MKNVIENPDVERFIFLTFILEGYPLGNREMDL
jgi:hypothetical protein